MDMTVDDLLSELFQLQDYGMGDKPIKVKVLDNEGNEVFYLPIDNIDFDNPNKVKDIIITVKVGGENDKS